MAKTVRGLIADQVRGVKSRLEQHPPPEGKSIRQKDAASDWLSYLVWDAAKEVLRWQRALTPQQQEAVESGALATLADLGSDVSFNVSDPRVREYLAGRRQQITTTVANREGELRNSLAQGYEAGENLRDLMARVDQYGTNGGYRAERIARTEVISAMNDGALEGMRQAGMDYKQWVATRDERTRDTHAEVDGTVVGVDEDFEVGEGSGPAPGQIGLPEEDCQCRCTIVAVETPEG